MTNKQLTPASAYWSQLRNDEYLSFSKRLTARLVVAPLRQFPLISVEQTPEQMVGAIKVRRNPLGQYGLLYQHDRARPVRWARFTPPNKLSRSSFSADSTISGDAKLSTILRKVHAHQVVLVTVAEDAKQPMGVVVPYSLNKPAVRSFFYQWIMMFEIEMSEVVCRLYPADEWQSQGLLWPDELDRVKEIYRRREAREPGLRLGQCLFFSQTLKLIKADRRGRSLLEQPDPGLAQQLNDLRNEVMHPLSPLVSTDADVSSLLAHYEGLKRLVARFRLWRAELENA